MANNFSVELLLALYIYFFKFAFENENKHIKEYMKKEQQKKNNFKNELKSWAIVIIIALGLKATVIEAYQIPTGSMEDTVLVGDFIIGKKFLYGTRTPDWIGIPWTDIGFKIPYFRLPGFKKPNQGDIVIFKYPLNTRLNYIKRCVAAAGQTIVIKKGRVFVDGKVFKNPAESKFMAPIYPQSYEERKIFPKGAGNRDNYGPVYVPAKGDTLYFKKISTWIIKNIAELAHHKFGIYQNKMNIDGEPADYYVVEQDHYFMMGDNRHNSEDSRYWGFVPYDLIIGNPVITYLSWNKTIPLYQFSKIHKKIRWNRIGRIPK